MVGEEGEREERSSHGATEEFLQHQSNARADGEELIEQLSTEVEELKARLAAEESGLGEDAQTEEAEEVDEESSAADEINSPQPEDTISQPQTADESAQTIARLRKERETFTKDFFDIHLIMNQAFKPTTSQHPNGELQRSQPPRHLFYFAVLSQR